jgi:Icc-related predicted phosphoesterase
VPEPSSVIRVAALSDTHIRASAVVRRDALAWLEGAADVLVVAGDLTESGRIPEVEVVARALSRSPVPVYAVLGNHDRRGLRRMAMRKVLHDGGADLLDGEFRTLDLPTGGRIAIAGTTGTGGGFGGEPAEPGPAGKLARALMAKSRREVARLHRVLSEMERGGADVSLVLTHFSPTASTLGMEPPLKYWMLGNAGLGRVIDAHRIDLAIHGHAHLGSPEGTTPGGTPVRNVAVPTLGNVLLYHVGPGQRVEHAGGPCPGIVEPVADPGQFEQEPEPNMAL